MNKFTPQKNYLPIITWVKFVTAVKFYYWVLQLNLVFLIFWHLWGVTFILLAMVRQCKVYFVLHLTVDTCSTVAESIPLFHAMLFGKSGAALSYIDGILDLMINRVVPFAHFLLFQCVDIHRLWIWMIFIPCLFRFPHKLKYYISSQKSFSGSTFAQKTIISGV